jgi:hypothetical protein
LPPVTIKDNFTNEGNSSIRSRIQGQGGVMKSKKRPTRDDLAAAFRTIRDQYQIIKLLTERLRRQDQVLGTVLMAYPRLEELRIN